MTNLTTKFGSFESQIAAEHEIIVETLGLILAKLDLANTNLDTLITNGAINTRYLLQAIGNIAPCGDCDGQSIIVPPIATTPVAVNSDKCKRAQAFVDAVGRIIAVWDTFSSFDIASNYTIITRAIGEVIGEIAAGDTIPLPSFPEAVQLGGLIVSFTGYNLFAHTSLVDEYTPLVPSLWQGIYAANTAEGGKGFFDTAVAAGMSSGYLSDVVSATAYTALWNYYFDPASTPDLSAYSGSVCAIEGCFNYNSETACAGGSCRQYITWGEPFTAVTHVGAGTTWDKTVILLDDMFGARFTNTGVGPKRLIYNHSGGTATEFVYPETPHIIEVHTTAVVFDDSFNDGAFSIEVCVAGSY